MKKKRMLVICPYPIGVAAGQRLKYEQYFERWSKNGWDITISPYMDDTMWKVIHKRGYIFKKIKGVLRGHLQRLRDLISIPKYDLIYIFMYVTPLFTSAMERSVRLLAKKVIYDIEDNIHLQRKIMSQDDPNPITRFMKWRGKYEFLIRSSDHVITSSPFLNEYCLKINLKKKCTYISSSLDTDKYKINKEYSSDKKIVIGWTGTYSSKEYLELLNQVFLKLSKRVNFQLKIISNFEYHISGIEYENVNWSLDNEIEDLKAFDIGVYPLPLDKWVLGKSGLKAIQYMALGIPCVATNVGTAPILIQDKINGRLVETEEEWIDALEELILNSELRRQLGKQAQIDAVENYSLKKIGNMYDNVLESVIKN